MAEGKAVSNELDFVPLKEFLDDPKLGFAGFDVCKSEIINILLVGRSQSGKSTLLQTFMNPQQAVKGRGFSVTKEPEFHAFILNESQSGKSYTMNVLDTPGLREARIDDLKTRNDDEIIRLARTCISKQVTYLNVVIYMSVAGRTHELDTEAFNAVRNFLGEDFSDCSLLVLSHCEDMTRARIDQIIADMKLHPQTNEMIQYCKLGVLPYGTTNADLLIKDDDIDESEDNSFLERKLLVKRRLTKIQAMRKVIFETILNTAKQPRSISKLQGILDHINMQNKILIDEALGVEHEKWNEELEKRIQQFEERFKAMQKEEFDKFDKELKQQKEKQWEEYQSTIKSELESQKKDYQKQLEQEQQKQREEYDRQISLLNDAERKEQARLYAERLEKEARERERLFQELLQRQQQERERAYREQCERVEQERRQRFIAEQTADQERRRAEEERRYRLEAENKKSCAVM